MGAERRGRAFGDWPRVVAAGVVPDPANRTQIQARDLLAVKGYDTSATKLTCYSGAGFDEDLRAEARHDNPIQLVGLDTVYA